MLVLLDQRRGYLLVAVLVFKSHPSIFLRDVESAWILNMSGKKLGTLNTGFSLCSARESDRRSRDGFGGVRAARDGSGGLPVQPVGGEA